jgi:hypothetical protein
MDARHIEEPYINGLKVVGRQVRIALFDKNSILSNIHTITAAKSPDVDTTWKFSTKVTSYLHG